MEIKNDEMLITDESGEEIIFKILFYFHNDERAKDYYFLYKEEDPENVIVLASSDGESLEEVDEEEFDEAQQVFDAYNEDPLIQQAK